MRDVETLEVIRLDQPPAAAQSSVPSLRSNFAWTFVGNVLYAGCQWGMLSTLAKLGSPSIVGEFTFGLAVSAPVFMFTNLQLRAVQATDVNAEYGFANYFTLRLLTTFLGLILIAAVLPFSRTSFALGIVVLLVAVSKCIECMSDVTAGLLQKEERLERVAISQIVRGIGSVLVFSLTFARFHNLAVSVAVASGVWLAVLVFYDVPNARALMGTDAPFFHFDLRALSHLALLGLPLGWVATFASLTVNTPRYFLQHYRGLADQGIYASLSYLVVVINLIVVALSVSVTTRLAHLFAEGDHRHFVLLLTKLSALGGLTAAAGVPLTFLVGRPLLTFLYGREYADHVGLLSLFVVIAGIGTIGSFVFCGLTAARSFRAQVPIFLVAVLVGVAGAAVLVPRFGLTGACVGLLLSTMVVALGGIVALSKVVCLGGA